MEIAVLVTCFNRKIQTLSCLTKLYNSANIFNKANEEKILLSVFLTDDGCTDGTAESIKETFADKEITIIKGTGNLFWAGGMRHAWRTAIKSNKEWDFYLLLNDDTDVMDNCFDELLSVHKYSIDKYKQGGLYSGITCSKSDVEKITYGGSVWVNRLLAKSRFLHPLGVPQECDMTNANILLVSADTVDKIGIFSEVYTHGIADYDYSIMAKKAGFPVFVTARVCGKCDNDHMSIAEISAHVKKMTLKDRKKYFSHPLHSNKDYLVFIKRHSFLRYPLVAFGRFLNTYFPRLYYYISGVRNVD